ncbi:hypothetical protein SLEP1_g3726 [Rubroshorea leprosula]|uniref:Reverse transcriptase Ty1/copia-type domain-containing protein n=1 Tax=Rubroshorea leprosula TaxID=152421 RepID=A0AAV5HWU9_9ROSI|nr:hypothetical protein SLEP1_g3726 [Rubroshorea leprosula]
MFSSLSNFKVSSFHQPPFFTNPFIKLFPSDFDAGTFDELYNASPHAPSSSIEDDLPVGNALDNSDPSSTSSFVSPIGIASELVAPSSSHPTQIKTRSDGSVESYKTCLVTKGFTQEYGIDYEETFAPVARLTSVCILLAIAAIQRWKLFPMDVKNAFLNGDLEEEVYMKPPPGLTHSPNKVCRLRRALYGLKQSPQAYHLSNDGYLLSQVKYASDLVSKAKLSDGKSVSTRLEPNVKLTPMDGSPLSDPTCYRQLFMAAPRSTHYVAVLRIIRYVKGTLFHGLHFSTNSSPVLRAYSDVDWTGDLFDRRSTTGYCLFLGNSLISWRSKKQTIPSRSSIEAKYRALGDTTSELLSL